MEANIKTHRLKQGLKRINVHWNYTPSHTTKVTVAKVNELGMNLMPHSPYSPNIAPSDFFVFGYLKHKLQRCPYDSADEIVSAIRDLMENLEKSLLHRAFDERISSFHLIVEIDGEDLQTWQKILLLTQ
jgi:hypothetical protein